VFLSDEEKLHLFDDLTKVNPVTTTTGKQPARGVSPGESLALVALMYGSYRSHCINTVVNTVVKDSNPTEA